MILKVNDTEDFNITMNLDICYEAGRIEITVNVRNKKANTVRTRVFPSVDFDEAINYYERESKFLIGTN